MAYGRNQRSVPARKYLTDDWIRDYVILLQHSFQKLFQQSSKRTKNRLFNDLFSKRYVWNRTNVFRSLLVDSRHLCVREINRLDFSFFFLPHWTQRRSVPSRLNERAAYFLTRVCSMCDYGMVCTTHAGGRDHGFESVTWSCNSRTNKMRKSRLLIIRLLINYSIVRYFVIQWIWFLLRSGVTDRRGPNIEKCPFGDHNSIV